MKKFEIVKEAKEFDKIIHKGKYNKNKYFILYNNESENNYPRFGIAVGKKTGNAVMRNKQKRKIRTIIDKNKKTFPNHRDYIIIMKGSALTLSFSKMEQELINLIKE